MKTIDTLVEDIYEVINGNGGWDASVNAFFEKSIANTTRRRLQHPEERDRTKVGMSSIGQPCARKLWYSTNVDVEPEALEANTKLKFLYGDILEDLLLSLAIAAEHSVEGMQDEMDLCGIKGHRDCVIDGVTVDIKSASTYSFKKFKENNLREDDPFGYLNQLSSYVAAAKDDPLVTDKKHGAFLVIDKQHGHLCLDKYDLSDELSKIEATITLRKEMVKLDNPPEREYTSIPEGKSGNMKLGVSCSYCGFKEECWPGLRTFVYARGPVFLSTVKKPPNVPEAT